MGGEVSAGCGAKRSLGEGLLAYRQVNADRSGPAGDCHAQNAVVGEWSADVFPEQGSVVLQEQVPVRELELVMDS